MLYLFLSLKLFTFLFIQWINIKVLCRIELWTKINNAKSKMKISLQCHVSQQKKSKMNYSVSPNCVSDKCFCCFVEWNIFHCAPPPPPSLNKFYRYFLFVLYFCCSWQRALVCAFFSYSWTPVFSQLIYLKSLEWLENLHTFQLSYRYSSQIYFSSHWSIINETFLISTLSSPMWILLPFHVWS